ncbi:hypothetical protein EBAPG3_003615 [Nitrosospira lacus]|uniref:EF-hand domain-containing protein n=1 Tax=Nitrosospira lacus TaxID=1288494 RepID=A0A1W6SMA6_9PROT|nr:EF-hand domain-containing protein [Nitrosospira lacus]ARO86930.1 hypothetical protein EBAPG3_003615 [Nitrosospira lacus]
MRNKKTMISLAVGSAFAAALGAAPLASGADSPFIVQSLDRGTMLAYADRVDPNKYGGGAKSGEGRCGMSMVDTNKDGKVTKQEFLKHHEAIFDRMDTNKDGAVDQPEADSYGGARPSGAPHAPGAPDTAPHGGMKK